ncbi:MAG: CoA-binding protein [Anaerolineales bacterium]|nr:CoA-binding protein [Anaerolineales bacterium]MCB8990425.1 CoA-binding protein [Ardenticatenaceae bacterium]MCB9003439.1 CoA-binding protein [Ardenticatenaceae bacterium]
MSFNEKAQEFLAQERIAVAGVSRSPQNTANGIYKTLRQSGRTVFAVNPNTDTAEGDPCYPSLQAIPGGVDGVIIITKPEITEQVVQDAVAAGVPRVWMHNNTFMPSSVSEKATAVCHENNITVIDGGCPMMFFDPFHKCMKWMLGAMGRLPK